MRIGIIGLKGHQGVVFQGAKELGGCSIVAVSDDNPRELAAFVKQQALAKDAQTYTDWRMLLEHSMLDVCVVCDETGVRADQLVALAERSIPIITEKPLTSSLSELARVRQALDKSKSHMTMLLTMRHDPKYLTMHKLVRSGAIGEVCQATSQKSYRLGMRPEWQKHRQRLGGTIPFIGVHAVDLIHWITGQNFTHVAAFHGNNGTPEFKETEDQASLLLRCANGASATVRLDYLRPETAPTHGDDRLRIAGSTGIIEAIGDDPELLLVTDREGPRKIKLEPSNNLFVDFVESMRAGRASRIPAEDCFYVTEVVLNAREAADDRKLVELKAGT